MERFISAVLVLVVALGGVATPVGAQSDTVTLTVTVVNQSGAQIGGVELTATWDGGSTTATTARNGKAFVDVPAGTPVEITVSNPTYVRNLPFRIESDEDREVTVGVHRKGSIDVSVTDSAGAVADAQVVVRKDGSIVTVGRTDADGEYDTGVIEQGEYTVTVVKATYLRNVSTVNVDGNVDTAVEIEQGSVTLSVNVLDPHFDPAEPVPEAQITVDSPQQNLGTFRTLSNGQQDVRVPVNTELTITVGKEGYESQSTTVSVDEDARDVTLEISRAPSLNLSAVSQRVVAGERLAVQVDDEYGDPVEGATITLDGEEAGDTDASGRATIRVTEEGEHTIEASTDSLTSDSVTVEAVSGDQATPAGTATAEPTATATPEADGGPFSNVPVPGFTPITAFVALLAVVLGARVVARR